MASVTTSVKDPVCGMTVNPASAKHHAAHEGINYHFCCAGCAEKFARDPAKYLQAKPAEGLVTLGVTSSKPVALPASTSKTNAYVCPMCPEVRETKPGPCPTCGMALESEMPVTAEHIEYTCPMHPQIVRDGPGSCPICGMRLNREP
jgi:P-type Cu+ transporter